jgi:hypothetical protein
MQNEAKKFLGVSLKHAKMNQNNMSFASKRKLKKSEKEHPNT